MWQQTEKPSSVTPKALSIGTELRDGGGPSGRGGAEPRGGGQRISFRSRGFHPRPITEALGCHSSRSFLMPFSTHRRRAAITVRSDFSLGVLGIESVAA